MFGSGVMICGEDKKWVQAQNGLIKNKYNEMGRLKGSRFKQEKCSSTCVIMKMKLDKNINKL